jgi:hypothetical protein
VIGRLYGVIPIGFPDQNEYEPGHTWPERMLWQV